MTEPQQQYTITEDELDELVMYGAVSMVRETRTRISEVVVSIRSRPAPSPCEENGCTDIDNCDEICDHSRVYTPIQMRDAVAKAREEVLDEIIAEMDKDSDAFINQYQSASYRLRVKAFIQCLRSSTEARK